jgi:hypothetical protein
MYYWNKSNFEGLQSLAAELAKKDGLTKLADYCRLRDTGLRREAFIALDEFLTTANTWDSDREQDAVEVILSLFVNTSNCHQFLTHPLMARFIDPVLHRWSQQAPESIAPIRWLGILRRDPEHLTRVLANEENDLLIRRMLIEHHLSSVDYATHHLGESLFLGQLEEVLESIEHAASLIEEAPVREPFFDLDRETRQYGQMLFDWQAYKARPIGTFPEWCAARGREYKWSVPVYYSQGAT